MAMRVIKPSKVFTPNKAWDAAIDKFEQLVVKQADALFDSTHSTWSAESTPDSLIERTNATDGYTWFVGRLGEIYFWVSGGTGPYPITSETGMFFNSEFTPKTNRGSLISGPGASGGDVVGPVFEVIHETEARDFDVSVYIEIRDFLPGQLSSISNALTRNIWT